MTYKKIVLLIIILVQFFAPASATENIKNFTGKFLYDVDYLGVNIGRVEVASFEEDANYAFYSWIYSSGVAEYFTKFLAAIEVEGRILNGEYSPVLFHYDYKSDKSHRITWLDWRDRLLAFEEVWPEIDFAHRPQIDNKLKEREVDIISAFLNMRAKIYEAHAGGKRHFSKNYYDGKRLVQAKITIKREEEIKIAGEKINAILVSMRREFLHGATQKEVASQDEGEPEMKIYFSNDESFLPVRIRLDLMFGSIFADLTKPRFAAY